MCVVSMIMDHKGDDWEKRLRRIKGDEWVNPGAPIPIPYPSKEELDEFKRLLERAREYDKRNNEPDCEMEEKRERIRKLAEELGVKVDFV